MPELDLDHIRTHYICYECADTFTTLDELRIHLQAKTAWTNQGLVGCRVGCLLENKEWHEGIVIQYHRSGKHYVEFKMMHEKRWLEMVRFTLAI